MSNIEDILFEWVQKIPNNLEREVTGVHIYSIDILRAGFSYESNESGIMVNLAVAFELKTEVYTKGL